MKIRDIVAPLEEFAPLASQEGYDNSGLVVGRPDDEATAAVLCVDVTPEVLDDAARLGAKLVISHHPIIFHPLRRLNGVEHVERVVERAVREGIALYACHTNLDRAAGGMSYRLAQKIGLRNIEALDPDVAHAADCRKEERGLQNSSGSETSGFGAIGDLPEPVGTLDFLRTVAGTLGVKCIRHSAVGRVDAENRDLQHGGNHEAGKGDEHRIWRVAVVTGSGGDMIEKAIAAGAELFLSADLRYDRFFTAGRIVVADIGHFESEFCAIELMHDVISKKIANFALHKSEGSRNPVSYLV